jgi:hypothetical protein
MIENMLEGFPLKIKYKNRTPDPGICAVIKIDWETKSLWWCNGAVRSVASFHEVEIIK